MNTPLRVLFLTLVLTLSWLTSARPSAAQVTRTDSAAVLLRAAVELEDDGEVDAAEALYRYLTERFAETPAGVQARRRLSGPEAVALSRSGRTELQVWSTLYGLWLGVAVPAAFGADDPEPYGVGLLLGGPAGLLAGRSIARSGAVTQGQARAITFGGSWGTWQGLGWADVLDLGEEVRCEPDYCYTTGDSSEERFAAMIVGGIAGIVAGSLIARQPVSAAVATGANLGALWGTWFGAAGSVLLDLEDDEAMVAALLGGNAGLVGGGFGTARLGMSRSRARMVSIAGVIGALGGLGLDLIIQPDGEKAVIAIPLVGSVAGLALGMATTRHFDRAPGVDGGSAGDLALLNLSEGALRLGTPMPVPALLPGVGARGPRARPALSVQLFRAAF